MQRLWYGGRNLERGGVGEKWVAKIWVVPFVRWRRGLGRDSSFREGCDLRYQDGGVGTAWGVLSVQEIKCDGLG